MNILVTGAGGFIGKNLVAALRCRDDINVCEYDIYTDTALLDEYCKQAEFVFHLAGVNRPETTDEFMTGNYGLSANLLETLKKHGNTCPILISSSTQAELDNPYGISKRASEDLLFDYGKQTGTQVYVYRLPNVFGKWCRPNYNSAVATFCYNIARDLPITVNDPEVVMNLVYIDDVVGEFMRVLDRNGTRNGDYYQIPVLHRVKLGSIADLLYSFKETRNTLNVPDLSDEFAKKLYATYLSYLPEDGFAYPLKMNIDNRGSFTEIIRTHDRGQFSVNISKPGITKGNHWHHTKNEKFAVVSGKGVIRFRKIDSDEILEYFVSGDKIEVVDIPPGYTHNIENLGDFDMVTFMWCNECFDPNNPDTIFLEV
ncbi:MAG: capsular polysaccharide biosynthesis protein CapF [Oscillospiraceae bacterium]|nr:capsular polysaccharide biosynthesis protein CapF [Oscillospiraceae bacterium]